MHLYNNCITIRIWTYYYHKNSRNKKQKFSFKNDRDVGMKKAQKQDVIQNGTVIIIYPFLHSTQYYSHFYRS